MSVLTMKRPAVPVDEIRLYQFSLPYRRALLGDPMRAGFLVCLRRGGLEGWGEISPWPGLHEQSVDTLADELPAMMRKCCDRGLPESMIQAVLPALNDAEPATETVRATRDLLHGLSPLVAWGMVSASLDLLASEEGVSVAQLFNPQAPDAIQIAALILEEQDFAADDFSDFSAIKVKSRHANGDALWAKVRERLPDIEIRADGNRMLTAAEAWRMIQSGQHLGIRFFEEPAPPAQLAELLQKGVAIALDEYLSGPDPDPSVLQGASAWVLKPSVLGPFRTFSLLHKDKPVILSSPFESAVGRRNLAQLQAAFSPGEAAGLGVDWYFSRDLCAPPQSRARFSCDAPLQIDTGQLREVGRWSRA